MVPGPIPATIYDLSSGGSVEYLLANLPSGVISEVEYFTGTDATATETEILDRLQRRQLDGRAVHEPARRGGQRDAIWSAADATGVNIKIIFDLSDGTSQVETFTAPAGRVALLTNTKSTADPDGTGTNTATIYDLSSGGSVEYLLTNLPSGATSEADYFTGTDAVGTESEISISNADGSAIDELLVNLPRGINNRPQFSTASLARQCLYPGTDPTPKSFSV